MDILRIILVVVSFPFAQCTSNLDPITYIKDFNNENALYSYYFPHSDNSDSYDPAIILSLHDNNIGKPCELYKLGSPGKSFSFIRIEINSIFPGSYNIKPGELTPSDYTPDQQKLAFVQFITVIDDKIVYSNTAIKGSINILTSPISKDDWKTNMQATAEVSVGFPTHNLKEVECSIAESAGSEIIIHECICEDDQGNQTKCKPSSTDENCCIDTNSDVIEYQANLSAKQCLNMCYSPPQMYRLCMELSI